MAMATEKEKKPQEAKEKYIRIPPDLWQELAALAKEHDRSVNGEATWAIRQYVSQQRGRPQGESP